MEEIKESCKSQNEQIVRVILDNGIEIEVATSEILDVVHAIKNKNRREMKFEEWIEESSKELISNSDNQNISAFLDEDLTNGLEDSKSDEKIDLNRNLNTTINQQEVVQSNNYSFYNDYFTEIQSYTTYKKDGITLVEYIMKDGSSRFAIVESINQINECINEYNKKRLVPGINSIAAAKSNNKIILSFIIQSIQLYYKLNEYLIFRKMEAKNRFELENDEVLKKIFDLKKQVEADLCNKVQLIQLSKIIKCNYGEFSEDLSVYENPYVNVNEENLIYIRNIMNCLVDLQVGSLNSTNAIDSLKSIDFEMVLGSIYGTTKINSLIKEKNCSKENIYKK